MSSSPMPSSPLMYAPTPLAKKRSLWAGPSPKATTKKRKVISSSSSDAPDAVDAVLFKKPLLPARFKTHLVAPRTPSSSSTAGTERMSSSPFPDMPSSPTRHSVPSTPFLEVPPISIDMPRDTAVLFGRSRHFRVCQPETSINSRGPPPPVLAARLETQDLPTQCYSLPRSATHASRLHAAVEYSVKRDVLRVIVMGQNGCKLSGELRVMPVSETDSKPRKTKRVRAGETVELARPLSGGLSPFTCIDFYGSRVHLQWPASRTQNQSQQVAISEEPMAIPSSPISDLPSDASSSGDSSDEEDSAAKDYEMALESDAASDLSPMPSSPAALLPSTPPTQVKPLPADTKPAFVVEKLVKLEKIEKAEKVEVVEEKPQEPTPLVPSSVDIPALLASTVVFSGSSATSLPDLVKALLESQPSLRSHASEAVWRTWSADVLESDAMFGKVQRNGKDASGHPLLPLFYYIPANDPDRSRANELGSLVRPLRSVQRGGGKAIDWRPVGSGRRRYY